MTTLANWLMASSAGQSVYLDFSSVVVNPNILALAKAKGWAVGGTLTINVLSNGDIGALVIPNEFPDGSVFVVNNGRIGGIGGDRNARGGTGIYTRRKITITNNGTIFGGGGGGGEGTGAQLCWSSDCHSANGGYGGRGGGYYSQDGSGNPGTWVYQSTGTAGFSGGYSSRPSTGYPGDGGSTISAGNGGSGGAVGQPGLPGGGANWSGSYSTSSTTVGAAPGLAGYYVDGNSYVTWLAAGTRLGNVI